MDKNSWKYGMLTIDEFFAGCKTFKHAGITMEEKPSIVEDYVLSPIVIEALQTDPHLNQLYEKLLELHKNAIPKVIQVSPTECKATYGDEFNELVAKIYLQIKFRQVQIISFYNR